MEYAWTNSGHLSKHCNLAWLRASRPASMTLTVGTTCSKITATYVNEFNNRENITLCNGEEVTPTFAVRSSGTLEGSLAFVASPDLNMTTLICYSEDASTNSYSNASFVISVVGEQLFGGGRAARRNDLRGANTRVHCISLLPFHRHTSSSIWCHLLCH